MRAIASDASIHWSHVFEEAVEEHSHRHASKFHNAHCARVGRSRTESEYFRVLVSSENISCVNLVLHVVEARVVAVGDDGVGEFLELVEVVDDFGAEECGAVFEGRFIDDDFSTFGLDAFHHALD